MKIFIYNSQYFFHIIINYQINEGKGKKVICSLIYEKSFEIDQHYCYSIPSLTPLHYIAFCNVM